MFGFHPVNLAFRFVLELCALAAMAVGSWALTASWELTAVRIVISAAIPLAAASAWATFNVPGDGSRSGEAPVPVPGIVRLIVEFDIFGLAAILLWFAWPAGAIALLLAVGIHYLFSLDRIGWLLRSGSPGE